MNYGVLPVYCPLTEIENGWRVLSFKKNRLIYLKCSTIHKVLKKNKGV
jgi:hypothetical protein